MKAKQIRRARMRILSKGYYLRRLEIFAYRCKHWHDFYDFECSTFIVGSEMCDYNLRIYNREYSRASAEYNWYKKKLNIK